MKVAVTGSTGLIGTALAASLRADGHQVVRLVRRPPRSSDEVRWDPRAADAGDPPLDGIDACVHLAGVPVGGHRWTRRYKTEIRASRVLATRALATALAAAQPLPKVLVAASAIGWYGDTGGQEVTEDAPAGKGFLSRVVHDWEAAAEPARQAGIRVAHARSGLVLGTDGGVLARLAGPARFGAAAQVRRRAPGDELDLADRRDPRDPLPARPGRHRPQRPLQPDRPESGDGRRAHRGVARGPQAPDFRWLRVPESALRLGLGEMSSELLNNARVLPRRLLAAGFRVRVPDDRGRASGRAGLRPAARAGY